MVAVMMVIFVQRMMEEVSEIQQNTPPGEQLIPKSPPLFRPVLCGQTLTHKATDSLLNSPSTRG